MITLIFGQLNCGKHSAANRLKTQLNEEVISLSDLRERCLNDEKFVAKISKRYGMYHLVDEELFLIAFCRTFTEKEMIIIVPSSCKEAAMLCCHLLSHVQCLLVAPSAAEIVKHRRASVKKYQYNADYFIQAKHYFDEEAIRRNTARLVKQTIAIAEAYDINDRLLLYVSPEYFC